MISLGFCGHWFVICGLAAFGCNYCRELNVCHLGEGSCPFREALIHLLSPETSSALVDSEEHSVGAGAGSSAEATLILSPSPTSQLSLNNKQLTQMLKSSAPVQEEEEDPLAYYEKHTSQIEARPVHCWVIDVHVAGEPHVCSDCLVPVTLHWEPSRRCASKAADGSFALQRAEGKAEPVRS